MANITIYTKTYCPYCDRAKALLKSKNKTYKEINLDNDPNEFENLKKKTSLKTVPQIFVNDKCIGGFQELVKLNSSDELDKLLNN